MSRFFEIISNFLRFKAFFFEKKSFISQITGFGPKPVTLAHVPGRGLMFVFFAKISDFSDYFVFITGETERHLETIANSISRMTKGKSLRVNHREGKGENGWILLDYNGLVVNIMTRDVREFYDLESLWSKGTEVLRMQ